jgi:pilus assembly protein CpaE
MSLSVTLLGSLDRDLYSTLRDRGYLVADSSAADVTALHPPGSKGPDAFIVDARGRAGLPRDLPSLRRQFPAAGFVVLADTLDPTGMLEAMRLGITEWLPMPLAMADVDGAVRRVTRSASTLAVAGQCFAIIGSKGGVGCTTIAVNLAMALRKATGEPTLLLDLHLAQGDAGIFLGVESRFTVLDALDNIQRLDDAYLKGLVTPSPSGLDLLAAANGAGAGTIDVMRVRALIEFVKTSYPWVVIDATRAEPAVTGALDAATTVVVVANQELPTLRSASHLATLLRQSCGASRIKLALSRFDPESEIGRQDVERVLGGVAGFTFPSDYRTAVTALNKGEPLVIGNQGTLATSFDLAARALAGLPAPTRNIVKPGFFARLGGRR